MQSKFSGNTFNAFKVNITCFSMMIFSLGFAMPWAICKRQKWYAEHTVIDGKQMVFNGTGKELFHKSIGWLILSIVTLGIFSIWSSLKTRRWITAHTHFVSVKAK